MKRLQKIKKKYKVAVCLYGHMRSFALCGPFLQWNLLRYYNSDLFIHTWSKLDHNTRTWHTYESYSGDATEADIYKAYGKITSLTIEEQLLEDLGYTSFFSGALEKSFDLLPATEKDIEKAFSAVPKRKGFSIFGMKSALHSMASAILAAKSHATQQHVNYDYIIVTRPDVCIRRPFLIDSLLENIDISDMEKNIITGCSDYNNSPCVLGIDLLFITKPELIFGCMVNKDYIINQLVTKSAFFYHPESVFFRLLNYSGYGYLPLPFIVDKDYSILRLN